MSYEDPYERIRPYAADELEPDRLAAAFGCLFLVGLAGVAGVMLLAAIGVFLAIAK